jgi:hypothetical protein
MQESHPLSTALTSLGVGKAEPPPETPAAFLAGLDTEGLARHLVRRLYQLHLDAPPIPPDGSALAEDVYLDALATSGERYRTRLGLATGRALLQVSEVLRVRRGTSAAAGLHRLLNLVERGRLEGAVPVIAGLVYEGSLRGHVGLGNVLDLQVRAMEVLCAFSLPKHLDLRPTWADLLDHPASALIGWRALCANWPVEVVVEALPRLLRTHARADGRVPLREALLVFRDSFPHGPVSLRDLALERLCVSSLERNPIESSCHALHEVLELEMAPLESLASCKRDIQRALSGVVRNPSIQALMMNFEAPIAGLLARPDAPPRYFEIQQLKRDRLRELLFPGSPPESLPGAVRVLLLGEDLPVPSPELRWHVRCAKAQAGSPSLRSTLQEYLLGSERAMRQHPSELQPIRRLLDLTRQIEA